jgi:ATP-dependent RNA helicase DOB1
MGVVESLTEADRGLLQVVGLKPLLVRGIGVHHSGLIPILREIVELLFQENLIQVLFSTGMV